MKQHGCGRKGHETPEYRSWCAMRERCNRPRHHAYSRYGGRGVTIDPSWDDFAVFLQDMGPRPKGTSLDRIKNELGYAPNNCRWATSTEQNRNSSNAKLSEADIDVMRTRVAAGETQRSVARDLGISEGHLSQILSGKYWPKLRDMP